MTHSHCHDSFTLSCVTHTMHPHTTHSHCPYAKSNWLGTHVKGLRHGVCPIYKIHFVYCPCTSQIAWAPTLQVSASLRESKYRSVCIHMWHTPHTTHSNCLSTQVTGLSVFAREWISVNLYSYVIHTPHTTHSSCRSTQVHSSCRSTQVHSSCRSTQVHSSCRSTHDSFKLPEHPGLEGLRASVTMSVRVNMSVRKSKTSATTAYCIWSVIQS